MLPESRDGAGKRSASTRVTQQVAAQFLGSRRRSQRSRIAPEITAQPNSVRAQFCFMLEEIFNYGLGMHGYPFSSHLI
jgi:hypothetical protein